MGRGLGWEKTDKLAWKTTHVILGVFRNNARVLALKLMWNRKRDQRGQSS